MDLEVDAGAVVSAVVVCFYECFELVAGEGLSDD